jgi:hypothetical protein
MRVKNDKREREIVSRRQIWREKESPSDAEPELIVGMEGISAFFNMNEKACLYARAEAAAPRGVQP